MEKQKLSEIFFKEMGGHLTMEECQYLVDIVDESSKELRLENDELKSNLEVAAETIKVCHASLCTYGDHPIINLRVESTLSQIKQTK